VSTSTAKPLSGAPCAPSRPPQARPPFNLMKTIDTGPITNHVNFAHAEKGTFAYVTIGGLNEVKVFRTDDFSPVATIPVGNLSTRYLL
jgi:hypothetical protein